MGAIPPYGMVPSIILYRADLFGLSCFLWRVRFWLRMNAGGVLNTCKSNGIHGACTVVRVANGRVMRDQPAPCSGIAPGNGW